MEKVQNVKESHISILVADDEGIIRNLFAKVLTRDGWKVTTAKDGREVVKAVEKDAFDLAIIDIKMPGLDGIGTLRRIKEIDPGIEVILITGYASLETAVEALRLGAYDYLSKPFDDMEKVVGIVKRAIEKRRIAVQDEKAREHIARLRNQLRRKVFELSVLYDMSTEIGSTLDLKKVLNLGLDKALVLLKAETGSIMLLDSEEKNLSIGAARGLSGDSIRTKTKVGEGIAGWVAQTGEPLLLIDGIEDPRFKKVRTGRRIKDALSVPIKVKGNVIGVFNVNDKMSGTFGEDDLKLFSILANEVGIAIENARLYGKVRRGLLNTVKSLVEAVEAKDVYTRGHSEQVARYAIAIGKELRLSRPEIENLEIAAKLHDVGKIGIAEEILLKRGRLTDEEYEAIKRHPRISTQILHPVNFSQETISAVRHHHEQPDGKGYPDGISREISLGAKILKVADAFDAMISDRPHRRALPVCKAIKELKRYSGTQFDPQVVKAFLKVYKGVRGKRKTSKKEK